MKHKPRLPNEWEISFCTNSLFSKRLLPPPPPPLPFFIFLPAPLPLALFLYRHLPMSAHLRGTDIWEMQFEHFSGTKGRQTMLEKWGDKHVAESVLDKHVAPPSIHKRPRHVRRSQVWKSKDKPDGARGRCRSRVCLLAELVSPLFVQIQSLRDEFALKWQQGDENKREDSPSNAEERLGASQDVLQIVLL